MKFRTVVSSFILLLGIQGALLLNVSAQTSLPEVYRLELKIVEETWHILDRYADQAWPGWKNNTDIPFRIDYPNGVSLYIGKPAPIGRHQTFDSTRMKFVDSTSLRGKMIYIDESRKNSIPLTARLAPGGGGAGLGRAIPDMNIRRMLITKENERNADSIWRASGGSPWPSQMHYSTDMQIMILVHELFHCYANFGPSYSTGDTLFSADLNYAVFSEIEGELIEKAANEPDPATVKDLLRQFLVARGMKRQGMSPKQRMYESDQEKCEGTATYAASQIVKLLKQGYVPSLSSNEDPLYFGFRYCDYFPAQDLDMFHNVRKSTLQVGGKAYATGYFMCQVLDKLLPDWKNDFFKRAVSMDQLIAQVAAPAPQDVASVLEAIQKEYHYTKLLERHSKVIGNRDSVMALFKDPQLKSFAIKYGGLSQMPFPIITSTGATYSNRLQIYYASGVADIRLGDMSCECNGIPMCEDIRLQAIILPDVEAQTEAFHYDIKFASQEAEQQIFRDVVITGKYFTLRAAKVKIDKTPSQVQFTLLPVKQ